MRLKAINKNAKGGPSGPPLGPNRVKGSFLEPSLTHANHALIIIDYIFWTKLTGQNCPGVLKYLCQNPTQPKLKSLSKPKLNLNLT